MNKWLDDTPRVSEFSTDNDTSIKKESVSDTSNEPILPTTSVSTNNKVGLCPGENSRKRPKCPSSNTLPRPKKIQRTIDRLQPGKSKGNLLFKKPNSESPSLSESMDNRSTTDKEQNPNQKNDDEPKLSLGTVLKNVDSIQLICKSIISSPNTHLSNEDEEDEGISKSVTSTDSDVHRFSDSKVSSASSKNTSIDKNVVKQETPQTKTATPNLSAWFKAFGGPKSKCKKEEEENVEKKKDEKIVTAPESKTTVSTNESSSTGMIAAVNNQHLTNISGCNTNESLSSFSQESMPSRAGHSPQQMSQSAEVISPTVSIDPQNRGAGFYQDAMSTGSSPYNSPYYTTPPRYSAQLPPTPSPLQQPTSPAYLAPASYDQPSSPSLYSQISPNPQQLPQSNQISAQNQSSVCSAQSPRSLQTSPYPQSSPQPMNYSQSSPQTQPSTPQTPGSSYSQPSPSTATSLNCPQVSPQQQHSPYSQSSPQPLPNYSQPSPHSTYSQVSPRPPSSTYSQSSPQPPSGATQSPSPYLQSELGMKRGVHQDPTPQSQQQFGFEPLLSHNQFDSSNAFSSGLADNAYARLSLGLVGHSTTPKDQQLLSIQRPDPKTEHLSPYARPVPSGQSDLELTLLQNLQNAAGVARKSPSVLPVTHQPVQPSLNAAKPKKTKKKKTQKESTPLPTNIASHQVKTTYSQFTSSTVDSMGLKQSNSAFNFTTATSNVTGTAATTAAYYDKESAPPAYAFLDDFRNPNLQEYYSMALRQQQQQQAQHQPQPQTNSTNVDESKLCTSQNAVVAAAARTYSGHPFLHTPGQRPNPYASPVPPYVPPHGHNIGVDPASYQHGSIGFLKRFSIIKKLGQGTYGKVQLGINKETGQEVAIKTIKKCKIETEADLVRIRREIQIMSSVHHPNIIHIYEVFENREKMVLVMEYAAGGELYDYLSEHKVLTEVEARRIFRQISTAIFYCHKHKICHRDLKLENILLDQNGNAKIADFGLSNVFNEQGLLSTFCGSPLYASPEIVNGTPYLGPEVDCWSLGVLLYTLVYGAMPFDGTNFKHLVKQITYSDYFEPKQPSRASPLIKDMLTVSPAQRADIERICSHWWVNEGYEQSCLYIAENLAAQTPVRLDLLLSLVPEQQLVKPQEQDEPTANETSLDNNNKLADAVVPASRCYSQERLMQVDKMGGWTLPKSNQEKKVEAPVGEVLLPKIENSIEKIKSTKEEQEKILPKVDNDARRPRPYKKATKKQFLHLTDPNKLVMKPQPTVKTEEESPKIVKLVEKAPADDKQNKEKKSLSPEKAKAPKKLRIKALSLDSEMATKIEPIVAHKPPTERRRSKIFETAEKFNQLLSTSSSTESEKPAKKLFIPGVNVEGAKAAFERKASLSSSTIPQTLKPAVTKIIIDVPQQIENKIDNSRSEDYVYDREEEKRRAVNIITGALGKPPMQRKYSAGSLASSDSNNKILKPEEFKIPIEIAEASSRAMNRSLSSDKKFQLENSKTELGSSTASGASEPSNLKSATLPRLRKTSKAKITLTSVPSPDLSSSVRSSFDIGSKINQHQLPSHRSEMFFPINSHSTQSMDASKSVSASGPEPIRKSPREFIIPISMEDRTYVNSHNDSAKSEPMPKNLGHNRILRSHQVNTLLSDAGKDEPSVFPGFSKKNDEFLQNHLHRLRSSRPRYTLEHEDSLSSGEDDDDDGFEFLTAENLFSTLLSRVRNLTQRLNINDNPNDSIFPSSRLLSRIGSNSSQDFWNRNTEDKLFRPSVSSDKFGFPSNDESKDNMVDNMMNLAELISPRKNLYEDEIGRNARDLTSTSKTKPDLLPELTVEKPTSTERKPKAVELLQIILFIQRNIYKIIVWQVFVIRYRNFDFFHMMNWHWYLYLFYFSHWNVDLFYMMMMHTPTVHKSHKDYSCNKCEKKFGQKVYLRIHQKTAHESQKDYVCGKCEKKFGYKWLLLLHQKTVHEGRKDYTCDKCETKFGLKFNLLKHKRIVHEGRKDYACDKCNKKFGSKSELLRHQKLVHNGQKDYECNKCKNKFGQKSDLLKHQRTVHEGRKDHACDKCEKKFGRKSDLLKHQKIVHEGRKDYTCDKCEKKFGERSNLIKHQEIVHEGRKDFACDKCGKKFGQKIQLNTHQKTIHEGLKDFACENCEQKFVEKRKLMRHQMAVHEGRKDFACVKCEKKCRDRTDLTRHQKIVHEGFKDFACDKCDKKFGEKSKLIRHQESVHENRKDFACVKCEKKCRDRTDLTRHQKIVHEGFKDFACDKCETKFGQKAYLLKHQRTVHEGRKDYSCDNCEKKFGLKQHLLVHKRTVHDGRKDFACDKCNKKFGYKQQLSRHQRIIHEGRKDFACDNERWRITSTQQRMIQSDSNLPDSNLCLPICRRIGRRTIKTVDLINCQIQSLKVDIQSDLLVVDDHWLVWHYSISIQNQSLNSTYFCPEFQRVTFLFGAQCRIKRGAALNPAQLCKGHSRNSNWIDKRTKQRIKQLSGLLLILKNCTQSIVVSSTNVKSENIPLRQCKSCNRYWNCHPSCHSRISVFHNTPLIAWSPKMHLPVQKVEVVILWLCETKQICSQPKKRELIISTLLNHIVNPAYTKVIMHAVGLHSALAIKRQRKRREEQRRAKERRYSLHSAESGKTSPRASTNSIDYSPHFPAMKAKHSIIHGIDYRVATTFGMLHIGKYTMSVTERNLPQGHILNNCSSYTKRIVHV
ncbi:unnamed protein product [Trichogramma brassicae]|uniref:Protein kinase domain-containing protein n=1 Tax=Trichogramma brassicae TaxID=86971 RepID=A0A6H5IZ83_9HYME|nr:unnamed protein product [Trichogramma brassicae]